jgi:hypothetical protein
MLGEGRAVPNKRAWTEEEIAKLKMMIERGYSAIRVALALKRPTASVKDRARQIGVPFPHAVDLKRKRKKIMGSA